jgi:hypothetical protein
MPTHPPSRLLLAKRRNAITPPTTRMRSAHQADHLHSPDPKTGLGVDASKHPPVQCVAVGWPKKRSSSQFEVVTAVAVAALQQLATTRTTFMTHTNEWRYWFGGKPWSVPVDARGSSVVAARLRNTMRTPVHYVTRNNCSPTLWSHATIAITLE